MTTMSIKGTPNNDFRCYSDLITLPTYIERFNYLKLGGRVGEDTFGFDRHMNQNLYQRSQRWKKARDLVIIRDNGCDLGVEGHEIYGKILVHHINPITIEDILYDRDWIYDPEFLISTMHTTHNAIHYGDEKLLMTAPTVRIPNDTCPWRK